MPGKRVWSVGSVRLFAVAAGLVFGLTWLSLGDAVGQTTDKPAPASQASPGTSGTQGGVNDSEVIAFINDNIKKGWDENKIKPSATAGNYEFLRRVYLDIIGRVPSVEEITAYEARVAKTKSVPQARAEEIEYLLQTEDYARHWANHWTVWLITRTSQNGIDREKLRLWLEDCFALNMPYNKMVTELLTASGKANENGPVNFLLSHFGEKTANVDVPDPKNPGRMIKKPARDGQYEMVPVTSRVTKLFLGVQTQCTQCHDHPFIDDRKQKQFWGINAYFRQLERTDVAQNRQAMGQFMTLTENQSANESGHIYYEQRNGLLLRASPIYLDGAKIASATGISRREELAKLFVKDPYFSKEIVNRMWGQFMGRGFTHPVDDFGEHNAVSHPELLDKMANDFRATGFDLRRLVRWIANSQPYQLSSLSNPTNENQDAEPFFSRMLLKSMSPEQLVDSIFTATNAENTKPSKEERRKMYDDWLRNFTTNFGDDEGNEATFNGTVVQALLLMNGQQLNAVIKGSNGSTLDKAMKDAKFKPVQRAWKARLDYLFLSALGRKPTTAEYNLAQRIGGSPNNPKDPDPVGPWEDIFWSLLNSNEFILNH